MLMPMVIGMLFVIGHDAAHNSLTPIGWLNRLLGRLVMLPAYHPYTSWCHAHNTLHHGWTNFKGRHPDFPPFTKEEFDRLPRWRRLAGALLPHAARHRAVLHASISTSATWSSRAREHRSPSPLWFHLDRLLVLAFFVVQLRRRVPADRPARRTWCCRAGSTPARRCCVPWARGSGSWGSCRTSSTRTRAWPGTTTRRSGRSTTCSSRSTAHVVFPWPIERLLNNIMDHPAHHLDPTIPLYNLPAVAEAARGDGRPARGRLPLDAVGVPAAPAPRASCTTSSGTAGPTSTASRPRRCNLPSLLMRQKQEKAETPLGASS